MRSLCNLVALAMAAGLCLFNPAVSQEKKEGPNLQEMMKLGQPGEHHKHLDALAGKWDLVLKLQGPGTGTTPSESKGTAEFKWIMERRFLVEEAKTQLFGKPFQWMGIYGYDNAGKKYTAVWVDNFQTHTEIGEGQCDGAGKVFTFVGESFNPGSKTKEKFKWVINVEGKDKIRTEMFQVSPEGKDTCMMVIHGTRAR